MMVVLAILVAAAFALALSRWLRLPNTPLLVVAGVLLQFTGVAAEGEMLRTGLMLGLAFLVFIAGTELNPARIGKQRKPAFILGFAQFFAIASVGIIAALVVGFGWHTALYVGLALTASSTLVVVTLLRQRQELFEPFGRLVLGALLLQDLLVIIAIGGLSGMDEGVHGVLVSLAGTGSLIVLALIFVRWVTPWLLMKLNLDEESLLLVVLAILFAFASLAYLLELPMVVGAFLAGVSLAGFPVNGLVRGQLNSLADYFVAVFFVALGASLVWLDPRELLLAVMLIVLVLFLTPPLVMWIGRMLGLPSRTSAESGLLLAQCSELSLVVALLGTQQGHVGEDLFAIVAVVTVVTMVLTPFIAHDAVTWRLMRWQLPHGWRSGEMRKNRPTNHVLVLGCDRNALVIVEKLKARGELVVVVDDNRQKIELLHKLGVRAVRGDGADYMILRDVGARQAKVIFSSMRRVEDHERMLRFTWRANVQVLARIFDPEQAERLAVLGAIPIIESDASARAFLNWFDMRTK